MLTQTTRCKAISTFVIALVLPLLAACGTEKTQEDLRVGDTAVGRVEDGVTTKSEQQAAKPSAAQKGLVWKGSSGNYNFTWRTDDITVDGGKGKVFSMREAALKERSPIDTTKDASEPCTSEENILLLSVVGTIMSVERSEYYMCPGAAHPGMMTWYQSVDVAHPDREPKLTDFFNESDILNALLDDALVKKSLAKEEGSPAPPATLDELVKRLAATPTECEYMFDDDLLTRFAFHHIENGKVAVRLGLSDGAGACRGMLTQIGILLPIPKSLASQLERASNGAEGILMQEMKKIAGNNSTFIKVQ